MTTFAEMTDSILLHLYGFTTTQDQATYLTSGVNAAAVSLPVADASALSRGLVEIDDELLWVDTVDATANTATAPPYGRAFRGTVAASHASGVRVTASPMIPRSAVKRAVNEVIQAVYPDLFGVTATTFTYVAGTYTYALPAGAETIIQVQWQDSAVATEWLKVRRYSLDGNADTTTFPTGTTITVNDNIIPGRTVHVVYSKQPTVLSADDDVFTTVTGLPASCEDVIRLGASQRLVMFLDIPHMNGFTAEADFAKNNRPAGTASQLAKSMMQNYQLRLQQESIRLQGLYPVNVRYSF